MTRTPIAGSLAMLAAAIAAAGPRDATAQSPRWRELGKTSVGNTVFVDQRSVKRDSGIVTATLRVVMTKPVATPKGGITSSRTVAMLDCAKRLVAVKENIYFIDEKTNSIYQQSKVGKPGFGPAIKGTLPDVALNELCK